jgi:hypothetical protein
MSKLESAAFNGTELNRIQSQVVSSGEVRMAVFATDDLLFRQLVDRMYDAHVMTWEAHHAQGSFPVTRDEWMKYAFTALRSRLARVNDDHGQIRSDDEWQIPSMLATILNAIGRVTIDGPTITYIPVWNAEYNDMLLTRPQWVEVTAKMRAAAADREYCKFIFVRNLAGDRSGDEMIMDLVPVRDLTGRIVRLHHTMPFDGLAAFVYLACGFLPEAFSALDVTIHPKLLPKKFMWTAALEGGADEVAFRSVS